jgi:hypothetical protein
MIIGLLLVRDTSPASLRKIMKSVLPKAAGPIERDQQFNEKSQNVRATPLRRNPAQL